MRRTRPQGPDNIGDLRTTLRQLDNKLRAGSSKQGEVEKEIAAELGGYFYRNDASFFLGIAIMKKQPCRWKMMECPIDDKFLPAIQKLTAKAGTAVWKSTSFLHIAPLAPTVSAALGPTQQH
ncbi:phosphoglycerate mutase [Colletotrichum musicola]|uniref:Phosphoglycerate mutase n=1 Tax=Colletotrichum musicola TaxID=2175873 RepID=A0A8H6MIF0_9PEZI|nr:phosphoglycerate mutase [Colletotrichum musicola]